MAGRRCKSTSPVAVRELPPLQAQPSILSLIARLLAALLRALAGHVAGCSRAQGQDIYNPIGKKSRDVSL